MKVKPIILIVDDEHDYRFILQMLLSNIADVVLAENGEVGKELFLSCRPDLIITDYQMPIRDGVWLLDFIYAISPQTPVIMTSASWDISEKYVLEKGAYAFMRKPYFIQEVINLVDRALIQMQSSSRSCNLICSI